MIRAHIRLNTIDEAREFVRAINSDGSIDKYVITDNESHFCADARSILGVIYAMTDFNDRTYLINETTDGKFPSAVDAYRIIG